MKKKKEAQPANTETPASNGQSDTKKKKESSQADKPTSPQPPIPADKKTTEVLEEDPIDEPDEPIGTAPPKPVSEELTEDRVIQTIVLGSDWQEVLTQLVTEEGLNPEDVDLIQLTDAFLVYLRRLQTFDFRAPARFILIAAILLRMKMELLFEEEEKKAATEKIVEPLNLDVPILLPPAIRQPTRKVTLGELISALNKAFEFKEKKETKEIRMRGAVENLIERPKEDIETRIKNIYARIAQARRITFSELVPTWRRKEIVETLMPLLYLDQRGMVTCEQEDMFKEIYITVHIPGESKPEPAV